MTDNPYCPGLDYARREAELMAPVTLFLKNRELIEASQRGETATNRTGLEIVGNPEDVGVVP